MFSFFRVLVLLFLAFCDNVLHLRYFRIAETLVPQALSRAVDPCLTCRGSQVRVLYRPPLKLLEPQGFGSFLILMGIRETGKYDKNTTLF